MAFRKKNINFLLYLDTENGTRKNARKLRKNQTEAEKVLWGAIKGRQCAGMKFRRQYPIHYYVADFYCHEERLIIEVDGSIHLRSNVIEHDENRTSELCRYGIRIIRFSNEEVLHNLQEVIERIKAYAKNNPYQVK